MRQRRPGYNSRYEYLFFFLFKTEKTHLFRQVLAHVMGAFRLQGGVERSLRRLKHLFGSLAVLPGAPVDDPPRRLRVFHGVPVPRIRKRPGTWSLIAKTATFTSH